MLSAFLRLLILIVAGFIIAQLLGVVIIMGSGFSISEGGISKLPPLTMKLILLTSHIFTFIIPCVVFIVLNYKQDKWKILRLTSKIDYKLVLACLFLVIVSYPAVTYSYTVNSWLPLADWMISQEETTAATLEKILSMDSIGSLFLNIFIIAIIPAVGEELLFRGLLLDFIEKSSKNIHLAVWGSALAFSLFHLQFEGFLPRLLLGALLGYSFVFTRNLWVPIFFHLINNALPVASLYFFGDDLAAINPQDAPPLHWSAGLGSLVLGIIVAIFIYRKSKWDEFSKT